MGKFALGLLFVLALSSGPHLLHADDTANNQTCNEVFGLPEGTIMRGTTAIEKKLMNAETCEAYKFLITRYDIGSRSAPCISSKAQGITGLNPSFAVALAKTLRAMPDNVRVISSLRPRQCQGSVNPDSNHVYGCAVDLGWDQNSCNSEGCKWMLQKGGENGLQIRMKYAPEWNHIEPTDVQKCRAGGAGATPTGPQTAPSQQPSSPYPGTPPGTNNYCMTSIDPIVIVAISGAPGPNCYNYQQSPPPPPPPQQMQQSQQPLQYMPQQSSSGSGSGSGTSAAVSSSNGNQTTIPNLVSTPVSVVAQPTTTPYAQLMNLVNYTPTTTQAIEATSSNMSINKNLDSYNSVEEITSETSTLLPGTTKTVAIDYPFAAQETFRSDDLRGSVSTASPATTSSLRGFNVNILANLRSILLNILRYLNVRSRTTVQTSPNLNTLHNTTPTIPGTVPPGSVIPD